MATHLPDDLKGQPWVDVLKTLGEELRSFIQQEMQLVKVELGSKIKQAGMGAGMFGAAGFMGFLAVGALTAAAILALALAGKKKVQAATPLAPEQAIRTVQAAREQVQQAWERGSHEVSEPRADAGGWTAGGTPGATTGGPSGSPEGVANNEEPASPIREGVANNEEPASPIREGVANNEEPASPIREGVANNEEPASPIRTAPFRTSPPRY
jgi:hypothetical protein